MNKKLVAFVVAAFLSVPVMASAHTFTAEDDEIVVEGHTVFSVLEVNKEFEEQGFDIAILVRDIRRDVGPNVLWFNDQWKTFVGDDLDSRHPCGGYVIAAPIDAELFGTLALTADEATGLQYVRSYRITDPNGFQSITDFYYLPAAALGLIPVFVTSVQNSWVDDDGLQHCDPIQDADSLSYGHGTADHPTFNRDVGYDGCKDPLDCEDPTDNNPPTPYDNYLFYNADIFGIWSDLDGWVNGVVEHGNGGLDDGDQTACEPDSEWNECPVGSVDGVDENEGNSHPYNPNEADSGPLHAHGTAALNVWFSSICPDILGGPGSCEPTVARSFYIDDLNAVEPQPANYVCQPGGLDNIDTQGYNDPSCDGP